MQSGELGGVVVWTVWTHSERFWVQYLPLLCSVFKLHLDMTEHFFTKYNQKKRFMDV